MTLKSANMTLSANKRIIVALACSVVVTLYLFYLDEGAYNFYWMASAGNWIPFFFYSGAILGIQLLVSEVVLMKCNAQLKTIATLTTAVGILVLMLLTFSK